LQYGRNVYVVVSSPYVDRGSFVYGQNVNSPAVYVVYNTYVTMSYVVFSSLGNSIAKRTFATQLPYFLLRSSSFLETHVYQC